MGDRKVTNKYIPADFDPKLVPRGKKLSKKDGTVPVRMMLPFSVQCETCNTFMYRGRKFNSKKEPMGGPDGKYLGIQRFRFYIKCTQCARSISFLTDPKNADYEMESGGTRNYEVYKDQEKTEERSMLDQAEQEKMDPMKALENRVLESQREMADLDNLEEIRAMNRRHTQLMNKSGNHFGDDAKALLDAIEAKKKVKSSPIELNENGITAEDEELVKSIKFGNTQHKSLSAADEDDNTERNALIAAKRKRDEPETNGSRAVRGDDGTKAVSLPKVPILKKKKKRKTVGTAEPVEEKKTETPTPKTQITSLLGGYGSDSDSD